MAIYGTALLSICLLAGVVVGRLLGLAIGIDANVGGVGIAMLLLIFASSRLQASGLLAKPTENGVLFWSSIYVPIVVAMAASQNVRAAASGGTVAILTGVFAVLISFSMVPLISRIGAPNDESLAASTIASTKGDQE